MTRYTSGFRAALSLTFRGDRLLTADRHSFFCNLSQIIPEYVAEHIMRIINLFRLAIFLDIRWPNRPSVLANTAMLTCWKHRSTTQVHSDAIYSRGL